MDRAKFLNQEIAKIDGTRPSSHLAKHLKMALSPFVFYRGSAQLFYADLRPVDLCCTHFAQQYIGS
uniref:DUF2252 family protein n=1 Tax=uncultured Alteromonas sp. TaxID=179113 RepID=UPI0030DDAED6